MTAEAPQQTDQPPALKRRITGPLLFLFILGDVLGAGIYALMGKLPGRSAARCGRRWWWRCCSPC